MENVLQSQGRKVTAVYAHNDEMALGAIQAIRAASLRPGRDVLVVSIDGQRAALEAILRGDLGATVESNPRFGPLAFATLDRHLKGEAVPPRVLLEDRLFDANNAREFLDDAY
jgi:ribose transport system substrate-binding protein